VRTGVRGPALPAAASSAIPSFVVKELAASDRSQGRPLRGGSFFAFLPCTWAASRVTWRAPRPPSFVQAFPSRPDRFADVVFVRQVFRFRGRGGGPRPKTRFAPSGIPGRDNSSAARMNRWRCRLLISEVKPRPPRRCSTPARGRRAGGFNRRETQLLAVIDRAGVGSSFRARRRFGVEGSGRHHVGRAPLGRGIPGVASLTSTGRTVVPHLLAGRREKRSSGRPAQDPRRPNGSRVTPGGFRGEPRSAIG